MSQACHYARCCRSPRARRHSRGWSCSWRCRGTCTSRRVVMEMTVSRGRGIGVQPAQEAEAGQIARRMLWFALGGHLMTAAVTGVVSYFSEATNWYYLTASYLLSAALRTPRRTIG